MSHDLPKNHPRYQSLLIRDRLIEGFEKNVTAKAGLIAHGRGEAFDYIIGEETAPPAGKAIAAAAALMLSARKPVISVNGNVAALCPADTVALSNACGAALEVNLYYRSLEREEAIRAVLLANGAERVLGVGKNASGRVPGLESARAHVDPQGIMSADVVLLALEDGDRTELLKKSGKKIIAVDLNPFSRTAQYADVTIVDNVVRALPLLVQEIENLKNSKTNTSLLHKAIKSYDNRRVLGDMIRLIRRRLLRLARKGVFLSLQE